jgi:hypothetical protein
MASPRSADCAGRVAVVRTMSLFGCPHLWCLFGSLALCAFIGCGPGQTENREPGPAATKPAREPLPNVPDQSEPEVPGTSEPIGAVPATNATKTDAAATNEPASDEPVPDDARSDPEANDPPGSEAGLTDEPEPEDSRVSEGSDSSRYEFRGDHDPNGIGKFYMGREIAHVMGFAAAPWLERP